MLRSKNMRIVQNPTPSLFINSINWTIPQISGFHGGYVGNKKGFYSKFVISPVFTTVHLNNRVQWYLRIDWNHGNYKVSLKCLDEIASKATVVISFWDFQVSCKTLTLQKRQFVNVFDGFRKSSDGQDYEKEIKEIKSLCPLVHYRDPVKISCKIIFNEDSSDNICEQKFLETGFEKLLFESGNMSDVTFIVDGKKILAHKDILTTRNLVFQAMFEHEMMEKKENIVKIEDISYEAMKELLRYIYTNEVNEIEEIMEILIAANKYCVMDLHSLCEKALVDGIKDLNINNAIENLLLASTYNAPKFKSEVMKFIIYNLKSIVKTPQFKSLDADILHDLFEGIAELNVFALFQTINLNKPAGHATHNHPVYLN